MRGGRSSQYRLGAQHDENVYTPLSPTDDIGPDGKGAGGGMYPVIASASIAPASSTEPTFSAQGREIKREASAPPEELVLGEVIGPVADTRHIKKQPLDRVSRPRQETIKDKMIYKNPLSKKRVGGSDIYNNSQVSKNGAIYKNDFEGKRPSVYQEPSRPHDIYKSPFEGLRPTDIYENEADQTRDIYKSPVSVYDMYEPDHTILQKSSA